jgi:hypothetical protein
LTTRGLSPLSGPSFESDLTGLGVIGGFDWQNGRVLS